MLEISAPLAFSSLKLLEAAIHVFATVVACIQPKDSTTNPKALEIILVKRFVSGIIILGQIWLPKQN